MSDFGLAKDARSVKNNNETYPDMANESNDLDLVPRKPVNIPLAKGAPGKRRTSRHSEMKWAK